MAELKDPIIREIIRVSDDLQISKRKAAESLLRNFESEGLLSSAARVQDYLDKLKE